jgi:hypothetical protein
MLGLKPVLRAAVGLDQILGPPLGHIPDPAPLLRH